MYDEVINLLNRLADLVGTEQEEIQVIKMALIRADEIIRDHENRITRLENELNSGELIKEFKRGDA